MEALQTLCLPGAEPNSGQEPLAVLGFHSPGARRGSPTPLSPPGVRVSRAQLRLEAEHSTQQRPRRPPELLFESLLQSWVAPPRQS